MLDTKDEYEQYLLELKQVLDTVPTYIRNVDSNRAIIDCIISGIQTHCPFKFERNVFLLTFYQLNHDITRTTTSVSPEVITDELVSTLRLSPRYIAEALGYYNRTNQRTRQFYYDRIKEVRTILHNWNKLNKEQ